jgi:hypothetical protein
MRNRPILVVTGIVAVAVAVGIGALAVGNGDGPAPIRRAQTDTPGLAAAAPVGIDVPDVRGMPASDAREALDGAGLTFASVEPAVGTPGVVLRTRPSVGRGVPPDTPITLVVGVEPHRLESVPVAGRS